MSTPITSLDQVLGDPNWFADGFAPPSGIIGFTEVSRKEVISETFLDTRWNRAGHRRGGAHLSKVVAALGGKPAPHNLRFIWHTGFCCSTLLAQALDAPGLNLSLCEPMLLSDVAEAKRAGAFALHADLAKLPDVAFKLLSRGFDDTEAVTLKPAPAANHLLPEASMLPDCRHLFLYSSCESFVISIVRLGVDGANYARAMLEVMQRDGIAPEWTDESTRNLWPLRRAALVWHMQIAEFRKSTALHTRALDCDMLLADPAVMLGAIDRFLGLRLGTDHVERTVRGPLFRRNAKNPGEAFDSDRRRTEYDAVRKSLGSALGDAVAWSYEVFRDTPQGAPLPDLLLESEKASI